MGKMSEVVGELEQMGVLDEGPLPKERSEGAFKRSQSNRPSVYSLLDQALGTLDTAITALQGVKAVFKEMNLVLNKESTPAAVRMPPPVVNIYPSDLIADEEQSSDG